MIWAERQNSYDPPSGWLCTVGNKWGFGPLSTAFWRRRERGCQKPRLLACPNKCLSRIKTVTKTGRFKLSEWCSLPGEQKNVRLDWCNPSGIGSAHVRRVSWVMATLSSLAFVCFDTHTRYVLTHTHAQSYCKTHLQDVYGKPKFKSTWDKYFQACHQFSISSSICWIT